MLTDSSRVPRLSPPEMGGILAFRTSSTGDNVDMTHTQIVKASQLKPGNVVLVYGYDETGTGRDFEFVVESVRLLKRTVKITTDAARPSVLPLNEDVRILA